MLAFALVFAGVIFLGSGLGKLTARDAVGAFLRDLGVPLGARAPMALILGVAETGLGVCYLLGVVSRWLTLTGAVLAAGFVGAHLLAQLRGGSASCRCFGALDTDLNPVISAVRSVVLLVVMLSLALTTGLGHASTGIPVASVIPLLGGIMSALTYVLIFQLVNEAVSFRRRHRDIDQSLRASARRAELEAAAHQATGS
jgi:hypothetical protein